VYNHVKNRLAAQQQRGGGANCHLLERRSTLFKKRTKLATKKAAERRKLTHIIKRKYENDRGPQ